MSAPAKVTPEDYELAMDGLFASLDSSHEHTRQRHAKIWAPAASLPAERAERDTCIAAGLVTDAALIVPEDGDDA